MGHGDRFRRKALKRGYKVDEVDSFLDRAEATLARRMKGEGVTASDVRDVVFRTRFGGYDEWQVDLHLDRLEKELEEMAAGLPPRGSNGFRALEAGPAAFRDQTTGFAAEREQPGFAGRDERPGFAEQTTYDRPVYREEPVAAGYRDEPVTAGYGRDYPPAYDRGYRDEPVTAGYAREQARDYRSDPGYDRTGYDSRMGEDRPGYERAGGPDRNAYRDERVYARDARDAREAGYRDTDLRREPAEYRVPTGYRSEATYGADRGYRDPEATASGAPLGGAPAGLAGTGGPPGPLGAGAPVAAGVPRGARDYGREPQTGSLLFGESFRETLPPPRSLDPDTYGDRRAGKADATVEFPPVGGGTVSPFTNEDKSVVAESRATFRPRRFGSGYDPSQVERLFDAVQATMDGRGATTVTAADLTPSQFALVQGGYFEDDVDGALREVRQLFSRRMGG